MADIFNDSGIIVEGLDEVRSNMKADAEVKFADILDGKPYVLMTALFLVDCLQLQQNLK